MTRLRQTIARRLKDAQNTAAMLTPYNEIDMSATMGLRKEYKDLFEKKQILLDSFGVGRVGRIVRLAGDHDIGSSGKGAANGFKGFSAHNHGFTKGYFFKVP